MRGRFIPLSPVRKLVVDLTRLHVPSVPVQRTMNIAELVEARAVAKGRPAWSAIFAKAYALVAEEIPLLRQAYIKLPSPRLYEYPRSTVSMVVEREYQGEMVVLTTLIPDPAHMGVAAISEIIRRAKTVPLEQEKSFKRMLDLARWPTPIRRAIWWLGLNIGRQRGNYFGTFGISVYSVIVPLEVVRPDVWLLSQKEDHDAEEETPTGRDCREAAPGGGADVARTERCRCGALDWSYRGHVLSVAAGVRRVEERPGEAPEGS